MGKVLDKLNEVNAMSNVDLVARLRRLAGAKAIREYMNMKQDVNLDVELNLIDEEMVRRMARSDLRITPMVRVSHQTPSVPEENT